MEIEILLAESEYNSSVHQESHCHRTMSQNMIKYTYGTKAIEKL